MKLSEQIAETYQFSIKDEDLMAWEGCAKRLEAECDAAVAARDLAERLQADANAANAELRTKLLEARELVRALTEPGALSSARTWNRVDAAMFAWDAEPQLPGEPTK